MKNFLVGLVISLVLHSILLFSFQTSSDGVNLPIGRTVIGKFQFKEQEQEQQIIKNNSTSSAPPKEKTQQNVKKKILTQTANKNNLEYLSYLRTLIENKKDYPFVARKMKITGTNEVLMNIKKDGSYNFKLVKSAQSSVLNKATKSIFSNIQKLKPLPDDLSVLEITIPVVYELTN